MTVITLAYYRVTQNGMAPATAMRMLETFARTSTGRTVAWNRTAPRLTNAQAELIDGAAVAYLQARGLTAAPRVRPERPEAGSAPTVRDGKMLASEGSPE